MTTTELIKILQDNEKGGISHKSRNISLYINGRCMPNPQISLSGTGDGICGPEIDLDIEGDWFEQELCDDAISREAVATLVDELARAISDERGFMSRGRSTATIMQDILDLPSVTPQSLEQIKWERDTAINQLKELGYGFGERIEKCEDCISRTDLIAAMHLIMDDAKIGDDDEDYESLDDIKQQYIEIVKGMVSVKPEVKWIPVSEKLPNSYEYVLATMISPVTQLPFVSKLYTGENAKEKIEEAKVIAWMPIIKPYKEK